MGSTLRIKLRRAAAGELLRLPGTVARVNKSTEAIAEAANGASKGGYESGSRQGRTRWRGGVVTATYEAILDNARNNTLTKSMDAGKF